MKKHIYFILISILLTFVVGCSINNNQSPAPTAVPISNPQTGLLDPGIPVNPPQHPITLPEGYGITVFAEGLTGPRMMAFGPDQQLYVTEPSTGRVLSLPDRDLDGISDSIEIAIEGMIEPSGIAFYNDGSLYISETTRVMRFEDPDGDGYFQDQEILIAGIAAGGNTNRTIIFSPDWKHLYLAIGSSCNICEEHDERRASVMRFKADGSDGLIFAKGLRNVIGLAFRPENDILWAAVSEREGLSNGLPPETLYAIYLDANGGWPYCHAGRIVDPDLGNKESCDEGLLTPIYEFEAQTEPYGIEFYTGDQFPTADNQDLFVALHGTGNGSLTSGNKIVRIVFGTGIREPVQDFAVGWVLEDGSTWGTPTDLIQGPNGDLFVSDEISGVIYRIFYVK